MRPYVLVRAFAYLRKAFAEGDPDFNSFENAIFRAELALEAGEVQAAAEAVNAFGEQASETSRALAASGRLALRVGDPDDGVRKCRSAVRMWTKLQMNLPGQVPATSVDEFISELASLGMAALECQQWEEALSIFRQMVVMFPNEPQANYQLAQALMVCAEAQALSQDFDVVKNAPGGDSLQDSTYKRFEELLRVAAIKAGCANILSPDGIMEERDVEIKRTIGLCIRRGRACYIPILENATNLEFLLQTIMPENEDVASLVMAFRRCGAKDRIGRAAKVGWQPVYEEKDTRTDPLVLVQLALAEENLQIAIERAKESLASFKNMRQGWPSLAMIHFLLAKFYFMAEDFPAAEQAVQLALNLWPEEPRWQAFAAKTHMSQPTTNHLQQLGESIVFLEKAVELDPENGSHLLELGKIYLETGQIKRALQVLENSVRLDPNEAQTWLHLAQAQYLSGIWIRLR